MTDTEAAIHELELDAAWSASEHMRAENDSLQRHIAAEKQARIQYSIRADGFSRVAAAIQKMRAYSLTREEAFDLIIEQVNKTNDRLRQTD